MDNNDENLKNWYGSSPDTPYRKNNIVVVILSIGMVVALVAGFFLGFVVNVQGHTTDISQEDEQMQMLALVLDYLRDNYYKELSDEEWQSVIANGGTGLLQGAGDKYGHLLSPQEYYDLQNPKSTADGYTTYFGVSYSFTSGLGLVVSTVETDGSSYGVLQSGDIITRLTNMKTREGESVSAIGQTFDSINFADYTSDEVVEILAKTYSATFVFLRDGEMDSANITRGLVGDASNPYQYVEYYFDHDHTNVSITPKNNAVASTYNLRKLYNVDGTDIGYIRLTQFESNSATQFKAVMDIFKECGKKRLILDLKGNPGGNVAEATDIAGMLATGDLLSEEEKQGIVGWGKMRITTLKTRTMGDDTYSVYSSYNDYFDLPTTSRNIVIWTDGNSASASELLTGALLDYKTAFQMGTTTYGKGIAQSVEPLTQFQGKIVKNNGQVGNYCWAIYYTVAEYYSPLGTNIHGIGYTPTNEYNGLTSYSDLWQKTLYYWY